MGHLHGGIGLVDFLSARPGALEEDMIQFGVWKVWSRRKGLISSTGRFGKGAISG